MKKIVIIVFLGCILLLVSCGKNEIVDVSTELTTDRCWFNSDEEVEKFFKPDENGYVPAEKELNQYGVQYDEFIRWLIQEEGEPLTVYMGDECLIPYSEGKTEMSIWYDAGYYRRPCLYYWISMEDERIIFEIYRLSETEIQYAKEHTMYEFHEYFEPRNSWGGCILDSQWIAEVSEETVVLQDGAVDTFYIKEIVSGSSEYSGRRMFVYDNMCIQISGKTSVLDAIDWSQISLRAE